MFGIDDAIIVPAVTSLIGGMLSNAGSSAQASRQMAFQERMSSTSYQRAVKDMIAAGLNPALAYSQGGASSPGGASAQIEDVLSPAVSSAMAARRLSEDVKSMRVNRYIQQEIASRQGILLENQQDETRSRTALNLASAQNTQADTQLKLAQMPAAATAAEFAREHPMLNMWSDKIQEMLGGAVRSYIQLRGQGIQERRPLLRLQPRR